jgi:hypothetical protein
VPVVWNDESLIFVLDTGAARAGFDSSLKSRLGDPVGRTTLQTSTGLIDTEEFACPVATVGGLPLDGVETVFCTDLQPLRYAISIREMIADRHSAPVSAFATMPRGH